MEAESKDSHRTMRRTLIGHRKRGIFLVLAAIAVGLTLAVACPGQSESEEEKLVKAQTFDSINELQESPSEETIKKLRIFIESPLLDSYLRERAAFVLTDVSIRLEKEVEARDYLKGIALNQQMPVNLHSAAFANIDLIDQLSPPQKHGMMQVDVEGEIQVGARISLVIRVLSDIDVENAQVRAGVVKNSEVVESPIITIITRPPGWKGSLTANTLKELRFDFQIEREGQVKLPISYKFSFDSIDYEIEDQFLYFSITEAGGEFSRTAIFR